MRISFGMAGEGTIEGAGIYLEPEELGITQLSRHQLEEIAKTVPRTAALSFLSSIQVSMQIGTGEQEVYITELYPIFYSRTLIDAARKKGGLLITPLHLRLVIWLILRLGNSETERMTLMGHDFSAIGVLLLHSHKPLTPVVPQYDRPHRLYGPSMELTMVHHGYRNSTRGLEVFCEQGHILGRVLQKKSRDKRIEERYGFSFNQFQAVITAIWLHFKNQTVDTLSRMNKPVLDIWQLLGMAQANRSLGEYMYKTLAHDLEGASEPTGGNVADLLDLAAAPLAFRDGGIICLDLDYLQDQAAEALWRLTKKSVSAKEVPDLVNEAGDCFEEYCDDLLRAAEVARAEKGSWMASKDLLGNGADGLFVEGDVAVIFEYKLSALSASARFATDPAALAKDIDKKFIFGSGSDKKGFSQCAFHLKRILSERKKFNLVGVKVIVPCLITVEDPLTWAPCYSYIVDQAGPLFAEFGDLVTEPVTIHAEDLGLLAERSKLESLPEMIKVLSLSRLGHGTSENTLFLNTKNLILNIWSHKSLEESGLKVKIERPTDFIDWSLDHFEPLAQDCRPCSGCGSDTRIEKGSDGVYRWWCRNCSTSALCTDAEVADYIEGYQKDRSAYTDQL